MYVLDIGGGGEAQRITSLSTGATSPRLSPDGTMLLFTSSVYPGAADDEANKKIAAERKARKYNARVYDGFPIRYWDNWLDDMQPHVFVQPAEAGAQARDLLAGTKLAAAPGFAGTETASGQELVAAWTPDGKSVVFACSVNRNQAAFAGVRTHLYQVSVGRRAARNHLRPGQLQPVRSSGPTAKRSTAAQRRRRQGLPPGATGDVGVARLGRAEADRRRLRPLGRQLRLHSGFENHLPAGRGGGAREALHDARRGRRGEARRSR